MLLPSTKIKGVRMDCTPTVRSVQGNTIEIMLKATESGLKNINKSGENETKKR